MAFLLADSFQSSLEKLSGEEQKAAKLAAFELQISGLAASIESGSVNWPRATGLPLRAITTSVSAPVSIASTRRERWVGEIASPIASPSPLV